MISHDKYAQDLLKSMAKRLATVTLQYHVRERSDGPYLFIEVAQPAERFFRALREAQRDLSDDNPFKERATIARRKKAPADRLSLPEAQLLKATLSDSLTVDRHTFSEDFFSRYTRSVFGFEDQIVSNANHLVFGRRGSGKSSLLAYAMHHLQQRHQPYAWIDMQTYSGRDDVQVDAEILLEIVKQCLPSNSIALPQATLEELARSEVAHDVERKLKRILPQIRSLLSEIADQAGDISIFLDDLHVLPRNAQPRLLSTIYAVSRGNRCHLKISGIEQFTRTWDGRNNLGLQTPHDAQVLKLDYNLTMPDKSRDHIESILDAHAKFSGLPDVSYLCGTGVLSRLVWVAAAVPRDALNLFAQSMTRAAAQEQRRVSITSINAAASEMAEQKLRDMQQDVGEDADIQTALERVKRFCISEKKKNAFLLEMRNDEPFFKQVQELIALRLVHVLHEGITPHEAGRRYQALLLDYGFYVGIRAAKSVDLFQKDPERPSVKALRKLPILS